MSLCLALGATRCEGEARRVTTDAVLPVIYRFTFDTEFSQLLLYVVALGLVVYSALNGWRTASGGLDAQGKEVEPSADDRRNRALQYGLAGTALALFGLFYALPASSKVPFFGSGKGEGIPIHTYGILIGAGFISAVTVSSWLATREWPGPVGLKRREQIFDLAFYLFIGGILGSRELFVLVGWKDYTADGVKVAEAYAVIIDLLVLGGLIIAITFREKLIASAEARARLVDKAFQYFIGVVVGGRVVLSMLIGSKGLGGLGEMLGGGLVFYGGLIGASLAALWYCVANGIEFLRLADLAMPTVSLGQAFGRLGCFSAGCCWGDVTTHGRAPFAVEFPGSGVVKTLFGTPSSTPSLAFSSMSDRLHETRWVVEQTGQVTTQSVPGAQLISDWVAQHGHTLPVHPTQLYESFGQTVLFVVLLSLRRYRRFHGQIFATWLMCYACLRSTVELFRGDLERGTLHGLLDSRGFSSLAQLVPSGAWYNISTSQFISLCMFSLGAWLLVKNFRELAKAPKVDVSALTGAAQHG
jgi:phosphatidylglycerol:prolipoprotein diacylglycerol transferase